MLTNEHLPPPAATITLSEAVTQLAFGEQVVARGIGAAIACGRWGTERQPIFDRLAVAGTAICDMGIAGKIECMGSKTWGLPGDADRSREPVVILKREDFREYPRYVPGHDALWKKRRSDTEPDEYAGTFASFASGECFNDVVILREAFEAALSGRSWGSFPRFTVDEIDNWIRSTPHTWVKEARRAFMKQPHAKGLTAVFEDRWKAIKKNRVGRPRVR